MNNTLSERLTIVIIYNSYIQTQLTIKIYLIGKESTITHSFFKTCYGGFAKGDPLDILLGIRKRLSVQHRQLESNLWQ